MNNSLFITELSLCRIFPHEVRDRGRGTGIY